MKSKLKITANQVTLSRIVLMPIVGYLLYGSPNQMLCSVSLLGVLAATDWLDGYMARKEGPSVLGGLLDPIADKIFIAIVFLPLTELGVFPVWMTATIFARDFLVTTLRTSMAMRDAPVRTSLLAKFKTAIQMVAGGYIIFLWIRPDWWLTWALMLLAPCLPLIFMARRLIKGTKQGFRSSTMAVLLSLPIAISCFLGTQTTIWVLLYVVTGITITSGFSYLADAWKALWGTSGILKETTRFVLEGLLVPVAFICLIGRYQADFMSAMIILIISVELAIGGLGNLLGSKKIQMKFRWSALKSLLQVGLAAIALYLSYFKIETSRPVGEYCIILACAVTVVSAAISFWRHRAVYLSSM